MSGYTLSEAADADLLDIWGYVFELAQSYERANKTVGELHKTFARLAVFPSLGGHRDRFGPNVLAFAKGNYLVLYRVSPGGIEVVRVTGADADVLDGE